MNKREHIEDDLRKRILAYEDQLNSYMKEVESFRKKEVAIRVWGKTLNDVPTCRNKALQFVALSDGAFSFVAVSVGTCSFSM